MDSDKVASLIIVRGCCCHLSSFCRSYAGYVNFGKILAGVVHFPFLAEIINDQPEESHLGTIQYHCFWLFLRSNELIDANDSAEIPNVAKDNHIIFEAVFLGNLGIDLIDINLIIEFVAHFDQMVSSGFFIDKLSRVVWNGS